MALRCLADAGSTLDLDLGVPRKSRSGKERQSEQADCSDAVDYKDLEKS